MTEKLHDLLKPGARSAVRRLTSRTGARALAQIVEAAGWQFLLLDGRAVGSKAAFLEAAAAALRFPAWSGRNWDAFEELVNDLSWLPEGPGVVVLLDRLSRFAAAEPAQVRVLVEILESAMANRNRAQEIPVLFLLRGAGPRMESVG